MQDTVDLQGGFRETLELLPASATTRLPMGAARRLWHLQVVLEGATEVAQAALNVHTAKQTAYRQAFEAACEDAGITIPPGEQNVKIDWATGEVHFQPAEARER